MLRRLLVVAACVLVLAGTGSAAQSSWPPPGLVPEPTHSLTPGDRDPSVTPDTVLQTICVPGYAHNHRPKPAFTNKLKDQVAVNYGIENFSRGDYEGDHLIPISLGGNPEADGTVKNFWNQPWHFKVNGEDVGAKAKDGLEFYFYKRVCAGKIPLRRAQREIAKDWFKAWVKYGRPGAGHFGGG